MDSFISKGGRVDTVRTTQPNKSPRVTRDDGSHGNKSNPEHPEHDTPVDQIDIHVDDEAAAKEPVENDAQTSSVSLVMIRDAMIVQARQNKTPPEDADPEFKKALSAYKTYLSQTTMVPELQTTDEQGRKTKFGMLSDLVDHGLDRVNIQRGQSYDDLIISLWNQTFSTS